MAFVATQHPRKAREFYGETLGLRLISEDRFALAFDAHGIMLRVTIVEKVTVAPYTVLGWHVEDAVAAAKALAEAGVVFEWYPNLVQDAHGVWQAPGGTKVAWFKDPDGNTLSLAERAHLGTTTNSLAPPERGEGGGEGN